MTNRGCFYTQRYYPSLCESSFQVFLSWQVFYIFKFGSCILNVFPHSSCVQRRHYHRSHLTGLASPCPDFPCTTLSTCSTCVRQVLDQSQAVKYECTSQKYWTTQFLCCIWQEVLFLVLIFLTQKLRHLLTTTQIPVHSFLYRVKIKP